MVVFRLIEVAAACAMVSAATASITHSSHTHSSRSFGRGLNRPQQYEQCWEAGPVADAGFVGNHWASRSKVVASLRGGESTAEEEKASAEKSDSAEEPMEGLLGLDELEKTSFRELLGDKLLKVDDAKTGSTKEVSTAKALKGKVTCLYFGSKAVEDKIKEVGAGQQGGIITPTPVLSKVYKECKEAGRDMEMVYVPVADTEEAFKEHFKEMPWLAMAPNNASVANLMRKGAVQVLPSVVVLDEAGEVVTTDGYSNMVYFPEDFPWKNKDLIGLLGDTFTKADGTTVGPEALRGKKLGVYFSASWCAPCKQFTPVLIESYKKLQGMGEDFEIVFVSGDHTEEEWKEYHSSMPWLSVPFEGKRTAIITQLLGIRNLPTFLMFDEDLKLITPKARVEVMKDPECKEFPWRPKALDELSSSPERLAEGPVLLVFMEGASKDEQARISSMLQPIAEGRAEEAQEGGPVRPVSFLTASEIDQMSGPMRKLCKLEELQGKYKFMKSKKEVMKPKMVMLDLVRGQYSLSTANEVTEEAVTALLTGFDESTLDMEKFDVKEAMPEEGGDDSD